jgi:hypothetical protein
LTVDDDRRDDGEARFVTVGRRRSDGRHCLDAAFRNSANNLDEESK